MYKRKSIILSLLLILGTTLILSGCGTQPATNIGSTLEKIREQGYVTVGFANEKPYAYATETGQLTGLNVEIAREVLKALGIEEMQGVLTEFGSLIPGLKAKRFDMITAGMYLTPDRAKEVAFANPEYTIGGGLGSQSRQSP